MTPDGSGGLRVLIVEDYADGAESLAVLLRLEGHDVAIARDGPRALEQGLKYQPDVVLLDLALPGMSGYDVARVMVGRRPGRTPFVIAVTGYGGEEDRKRSAEVGIDLHLVKPVEPHRLCSLLKRFKKLIGK